MSTLFSPHAIGTLTLKNRIVIAPMYQYNAIDGSASDWWLAASSGQADFVALARGKGPQ